MLDEMVDTNGAMKRSMSLKFEGPKYGSKDKTKSNRILCDRVILVKQ